MVVRNASITSGIAQITVGLFGTFASSKRTALNCAIAAALQRNAAVILDFRHVAQCDASMLLLLSRYKQSFDERVQIVVSDVGAVRDAIDKAALWRSLGTSTSIGAAYERIEERYGVVPGGHGRP